MQRSDGNCIPFTAQLLMLYIPVSSSHHCIIKDAQWHTAESSQHLAYKQTEINWCISIWCFYVDCGKEKKMESKCKVKTIFLWYYTC